MEDNENRYKNKIITIPNILSFARICLIPLIIWLYVYKENYVLAIVFLGLSGITDIVDGYIARKFRMVSDFGKFFDALADKLTQLAMMLCVVRKWPPMLFMIVLLVVKELLLGSFVLFSIRKTGIVKSAEWHGKLATVLIYATIAVHFGWPGITDPISDVLIAICSLMMLVSAALYAIRTVRILKSVGQNIRDTHVGEATVRGTEDSSPSTDADGT